MEQVIETLKTGLGLARSFLSPGGLCIVGLVLVLGLLIVGLDLKSVKYSMR
jgi:hypothetical protein